MRGVTLAIIALMAMLAMPAVFASDAELVNLIGSCQPDGNAEIRMMHHGGAININDIAANAVFVLTGSSSGVRGVWSGLENPLYVSGDPLTATFSTTNSPFKKKGSYNLHFQFFPKPEDIIKTDVVVALECPGISCTSDYECDADSRCSNSTCVPLVCKKGEFIDLHTCVSKCNDFNPCTIDIYENGACRHERNESNCCRTDADCSLGKACSIDRCVNSKCEHTPVVCNAAKDKCVTSECTEPKGCIYQTDEACIANENENRQYLITIGEPKVYKQPFWQGFFGAIADFFRNLF